MNAKVCEKKASCTPQLELRGSKVNEPFPPQKFKLAALKQ